MPYCHRPGHNYRILCDQATQGLYSPHMKYITVHFTIIIRDNIAKIGKLHHHLTG